ncbi:uncharacterized protein BX663DRAFT_522233 [Cokeromyces recurvatus]|uniref:uncharacterized protein n=1 Tax=Cokeromyces recurvatus TaxID=90255 RepID=UPI00221F7B24|nr:uncharacterized protein BX663DRAFT_522233 [Cokeromyces recurvatus]KAI7899080.1 hypothetical protein BX663DRAFT_522233 [Cokeromyces recurvatus]
MFRFIVYPALFNSSFIILLRLMSGASACIFCCQKYTKVNVEKCLERIEEMEEVEICYIINSRCPLLQCTNRIYGKPGKYRLY